MFKLDLHSGNIAKSANQAKHPEFWVPGAHMYAPCLGASGERVFNMLGAGSMTLSGCTWVPGGLEFDGVDDYGFFPVAFSVPWTLLVVCQTYSTQPGGTYIRIGGSYAADGSRMQFDVAPSLNRTFVISHNNNPGYYAWDDASAFAGTVCLAATCASTVPEFYINAQNMGTRDLVGDPSDDTEVGFYLGAAARSPISRFWHGLIQTVIALPFVCTPDQIAELSADPLLPLRKKEEQLISYFSVVSGSLIRPRAFNYGLSHWNKGLK